LIALLMVLALSAPCVKTSAISEGSPAPCEGVLWPLKHTKRAVKCARVDLPTCKADLRVSRADLAVALSKTCPPVGAPPSRKWWWAIGGATVGSVFIVGIFFGSKAGAWR